MQPSLSEGTLITKDKKTSSSRNPKTESKSSKKEEKKDEKSKEEKSGEKTGKKDEEKSAEKPKKEEVKEDTSKKTENSPTEEKENKESDKKEGKSEGDKPRKSKSTKSAKKEAKEPKSEEPKSEEPKEEKKINQEQVELLKLEQQFTSQAIEKKNATAADLMALEQLYTAKSTPRLREEKKEVENGEKKESENPGIKITDEVKIDEKELSKDTDSLKSAKSKKLNKSFLSINIDTKETQECFEKHSAQFKALLDEPDNPAAEYDPFHFQFLFKFQFLFNFFSFLFFTRSLIKIRCFKYGGLFCTSPEGEEEILYLGIIDNLTGFGFNKKVANFCKSYVRYSSYSMKLFFNIPC